MKQSLVYVYCATLNDVYKISFAGQCPKQCRTELCDILAYLLCDGSILELGHRDTCYIQNVYIAQ